MKKRIRRFLTGLLCMILAFSQIAAPGIQVRASELETAGQETVVDEVIENGVDSDTQDAEEAESDVEIPDSQAEEIENQEEKSDEEENWQEESDLADLKEDNQEEEENIVTDDIGEEKQEQEEDIVTDDIEEVIQEQEEAPVADDIEEEVQDEELIAKSNEVENRDDELGNNIASGSYTEGGSDVTWVIDANGKLTVKGTGEFSYSEMDEIRFVPWRDYRTQIISAEICVTGMTDASFMFYDCDNLVSLDLSKFDTSQVKNMRYMFYNCNSLLYLDVSSFNTSQVKNMENMFYNCNSLLELDVSGFDTSQVTEIDQMFMNCSSLSELNLRNFDTSNIRESFQFLDGCSSLATIYTPYNLSAFIWLPIEEETDIWYDVEGNTYSRLPQNLSYSIVIARNEKPVLKNVISVRKEKTTYSCNDTVNIDDLTVTYYDNDGTASLVTDYSTNVDEIEMSTPGIKELVITYNDLEALIKLKVIEGDLDAIVVSGTSGDLSWSIDASGKLIVTGTGDFEDGVPWKQYRTSIISAEIKVTGMTDAFDMFEGCSSLVSVDLSDFETSTVTNMSGMFRECTNLGELDLSNFETSQVTDMSSMFSGCHSLKELDIHSFKTNQVTSMSYMFEECLSLKELDLSNIDTSQVRHIDGMFSYCRSLEVLDLKNFKTDQVTYMWGMFNGCNSLKEVDLSNFETSQVTDMSWMFRGCNSLKELDLSSFETSQVTDMSWMFRECNSLKELDLSNFNAEKVEDADDMFTGCSSLATIYTPYNLTQSVPLPTQTDLDIWYDSNGNTYTNLPQELSYSIVLTKKTEIDATGSLSIKKTKTVYECGETLNLDDLTVIYSDDRGVVVEVTAYTTNAEEIDMFTLGKKTLVITYQGISESIDLTVIYTLKEDGVKITLPDMAYVYDGLPKNPVPTVEVGSSILTEGKDYVLSYQDNVNAGMDAKVVITGQNNYVGSLTKTFTIEKASLTIAVKDILLVAGTALPETFDYSVTGLVNDDTLLTQPVFSYTDIDGNIIEKNAVDITKEGVYYIHPNGADAGTNYEISYQKGTLTISEERVFHTVTFNLSGHGEDMVQNNIKVGSLLEEPEKPVTEGYIFAGWYKDLSFAAAKAWDFTVDTVQSDITLYACWLATAENNGSSLCIQDILPQTYTGSAIKPNITVYDSDGVTLLKAGKDYTVKYAQNIAAVQVQTDPSGKLPELGTATVINAGKSGETVQNVTGSFSKDYPYVIITGKGNYSETIYKNFYILPVNISSEDKNGNMTLASSFALKCTEQLVKNNKKDQNPFSSLKYKKAMKLGLDYMLTMKAESDVKCDENISPAGDAIPSAWSGETTYNSTTKKFTAPAIPKGYYGTFTMTVTGIGNYSGTVTRTVVVSDKNHLMKYASVTIGKNQKSLPFEEGKALILTPGYYDTAAKKYYKVDENGSISSTPETNGNEIFTVKAGSEYLVYGKDYKINYIDNSAVGTATMTITGMGEYMGSKSVTFKITGAAFNAKTVLVDNNSFVTTMSYTGKALTQNRVTLTTKATNNTPARTLSYGTHYTISYKNNLKKGTATMTFTAKPESGYRGSFKKTFKITAQSLLNVTFVEKDVIEGVIDTNKSTKEIKWSDNEPAIYSKNGAALSFMLKNTEGMELKQGTDYTVSYKNNKAVTNDNTTNLPTMTVKGKGNYTGTLMVTFRIQKADIETALENGSLTVSAAAVAKTDNMKFKNFKFKVLDGKKAMSEGEEKDYTLDLSKCSDKIIQDYAEALSKMKEDGSAVTVQEPIVKITGKGNYTGEKEISLSEYIYITKLTTGNLYIVIPEDAGQTAYTGGQVRPEVSVYYGAADGIKAAKRDKVTDGTKLTDVSGIYKLTRLKPGTAENVGDYTLIYGENRTVGKNKGNVTVTGTGIYGGSVTAKFTIQSKNINYAFAFTAETCIYSKLDESFVRETLRASLDECSEDEYITLRVNVKNISNTLTTLQEAGISIDGGEKWDWADCTLEPGETVAYHVYYPDMQVLTPGLHTAAFYESGRQVDSCRFNIGREWTKDFNFPTAAEREACATDQRAPYVGSWLNIDWETRYDGYSVDIKSDYLAYGTYCCLSNFYLDLSSLKKQYKTVTQEGISGYAGLQRLGEGEGYTSILSLWDIFCTDETGRTVTIRAKRTYPEGTPDNSFSHEGSGKNAILPYDWKESHWYRMLLLCGTSEETGNTTIEQWIMDLETNKWTHTCTYDTGIPNSSFIGSTAFFLENYLTQYAGEVRSMEIANIRIRTISDGEWHDVTSTNNFTQSFGSGGSWCAGADPNSFYIITTGVTGKGSGVNTPTLTIQNRESGNPME